MPGPEKIIHLPRRHFPTQRGEVANYYRPLSKSEILEILSIDEIEFELWMLNENLCPSQSLEYHAGYFIGFFCYLDCLAAKIESVVSCYMDREVATEVSDEFFHVADFLMQLPYPNPLHTNEIYRVFSNLQASEIKLKIYCCPDEMLSELATVVVKMEERFRIIATEERGYYLSPFAVNIAPEEVVLSI